MKKSPHIKFAFITGLTLGLAVMSSSANAACAVVFGVMVANATCANTVNNTETGLATTNAQLAALTTQSSSGDAATLAAANGYTNYKAAETLKAANQYTDTKAAETLSTAKTYTDTKSSETLQAANTYTNEQVQKLDTKTAGGIAATTAMINIPAPVSAGSTMSFGVGIGSYDGQTAIAIGGQKRISDNGLVRFGIASGTGKGAKPAVGLGAAWEF